MNRQVRIVLIALFPCVMFGLLNCRRENEVRIGVISELTGPIAPFGKRARNGIELAAEEINRRGGIDGKKVRLIIEDDQSLPQKAATAMTKLSNVDDVDVVVGMVGSGMGMAAAPVANRTEVVLIACGVSTPAYSTANDYTFRIRGSAQRELEAMAQIAVSDYAVTRLAILHVQNEFGSTYKDTFKRSFEALGGKVVGIEVFASGATDLRPQLVKLKESAVRDVFLIAQGAENGYALRQARELGMNLRVFGTVGFEVPDALTVAGEAANGVVYVTTGYDRARNDPLVRNFDESYQRKYGTDSDLFSAEGYDALRLAVGAIAHAGNDAGRIRRYLVDAKEFTGVTGNITFDANGDPIRRTIFLKAIQGGKAVTLRSDIAR